MVADWSFSSSATSPRQKSDDSDLGRAEVLGRERGLAGARWADQHHQRQLGDVVRAAHRANTPSGSAPRPPDRRGRSVRTHRVAEALGDTAGPRRELRPGPLEAVVAMPQFPAGRLSKRTLYSTLGVVTTTEAGPRDLEQHPLEGAQPRGIDVLDHLDQDTPRRSPEARVAVGDRALQQLDPLALPRWAAAPGGAAWPAPAHGRDVHADDSLERRRRSARAAASLPASQVEHRAARRSLAGAITVAPRRCSFRLSRFSSGLLFLALLVPLVRVGPPRRRAARGPRASGAAAGAR